MKENDWIIASMNNPQFDAADFQAVAGMNLANTQLLSKEEYKKSSAITNSPLFQTNGSFDSQKFDDFYNSRIVSYNEFAADSALDNYEYDMWDTRRPANGRVKDPQFQMTRYPNPDHISIGIEGPNVESASEYSRRELAQRSKIFDTKEGKFRNESVNDLSLFENPFQYIKSLFDDPIVYAQWDSEGFHMDPFTKEMVKHEKGEWKINEDGEYYTETLNGRSLIGKEVVTASDYITKEDTFWNKYDFFDSDSLDKSVTGTIAKNLFAVAPMVFLGPIGASIYSGVFIAKELLKTLPMLDGIFKSVTGQVATDNVYFNNIAAFGERFTGSTSDYAKEHTFSFENIGNLLGDIPLQWGQQKAIAKAYSRISSGINNSLRGAEAKAAEMFQKKATQEIAKIGTGEKTAQQVMQVIGTTNDMEVAAKIVSGAWAETQLGKAAIDTFVKPVATALEGKMKLGQDLSLAYMALISNVDTYQSVLEHGGTNLEAAMIALGSTIGMFSVDKFAHLGELFFDDDIIRKSFREGWKKESQALIASMESKLGKAATEETSEQVKKKFTGLLGQVTNTAKNYIRDYQSAIKDHTLGFFGKSFGEGLEEVSEELVTDSAKWVGELLGHLGIASSTDYGAWEGALDRYMMSMLGGSLGGGLYYGVDAFQNRNKNKIREEEQELTYLIRNNKKEDLMRELDKLHKNGMLGSTELSYQTERTPNGEYFISDNGNNTMTQNDFVYEKLKEVYNHIDALVNFNKVNLSDEELFDKMILSEGRYRALSDVLEGAAYASGYFNDFHDIATQLVNISQEIEDLNKKTPDEAKRNDPQYQEKLEDLESAKKELVKRKDDMLKGTHSIHYLQKMQFLMDPILSSNFTTITRDQYSRLAYGKSFNQLTKMEQENLTKNYEKYKNSPAAKENSDRAFRHFQEMQELVKQDMLDLNKIDFSKDLEKARELLEQWPSNKYIDYNTRLDDESEEDYNDRSTRRENESEEEYNQRVEDRKQKIDTYNKINQGKWIQEMSKLGIDGTTFRLLSLIIGGRKQDILQHYANSLKIYDGKNRVNVEATKIFKDGIISGLSADEILNNIYELLRSQYIEKFMEENYNLVVNYSRFGAMYDPDPFTIDKLYKEIQGLSEGDTLSKLDIKDPDSLSKIQEALEQYMGTFLAKDYAFAIWSHQFLQKVQQDIKGIEDKAFIDASANQANGIALDSLLPEEREKIQTEANNKAKDEIIKYITSISQQLKKLEKSSDSAVSSTAKDLLDDTKHTQDASAFVSGVTNSIDLSVNSLNKTTASYTIDDVERIAEEQAKQVTNNMKKNVTLVVSKRDTDNNIPALDSLKANLYKNSPALQFLSKLSVKFNDKMSNIEDFMQALYERREATEDLKSFKLSEQEIATLKKIKAYLTTAKALLYAASKESYNDSPIGQNKSLNHFIKNHPDIFKTSELLPEIDKNLGDLLTIDLGLYETEIDMWLHTANSESVNKSSMFKTAANNLAKVRKDFFEECKDGLIVKGINLLEGYNSDMTITDAEMLLYKNVQKGLIEGKFKYEDVLELIPKFTKVENLIFQNPSKLDHNLQFFNDYDKFTYFISTIAMPVSSFNSKVGKFITENPDLVPIDLQIYVSRIAKTIQYNPKFVNTALEYIQRITNTELSYLPNTTICTGVGGAGKTEFVGRLAAENKGAGVWVSGPTKTQINNIVNEKLKEAKGLEIDDILKTFIPESIVAKINNNLDSNKGTNEIWDYTNIDGSPVINLKTSALNFKKVPEENLPRLIIIDEATHIPNVKLQILSEFAKKNNIKILLLADNCQIGYQQQKMGDISRWEILAWRTPKLYISLRDSNIQKFINQQRVLEILEPIMDYNSVNEHTSQLPNNIKKVESLRLRVFQNKDTLNGDIITDDISDEQIQILKNNTDSTGKPKPIGYIGSKDNTVYKKLEDAGLQIEQYDGIQNIQGSEFDYVVSTVNISEIPYNDKYEIQHYLRTLYTIITRSKKGTILVDKKLFDKNIVQNDPNTGPSTNIKEELPMWREEFQNMPEYQVKPNVDEPTIPDTNDSTTNDTDKDDNPGEDEGDSSGEDEGDNPPQEEDDQELPINDSDVINEVFEDQEKKNKEQKKEEQESKEKEVNTANEEAINQIAQVSGVRAYTNFTIAHVNQRVIDSSFGIDTLTDEDATNRTKITKNKGAKVFDAAKITKETPLEKIDKKTLKEVAIEAGLATKDTEDVLQTIKNNGIDSTEDLINYINAFRKYKYLIEVTDNELKVLETAYKKGIISIQPNAVGKRMSFKNYDTIWEQLNIKKGCTTFLKLAELCGTAQTKQWIGLKENIDISCFLTEGQVVSEQEFHNYTLLLMKTKNCLIQQLGNEQYNSLDSAITSIFSKESFENAKFYLRAEDKNDTNFLIGLTSLKEDPKLINGKILTLVAKLKNNKDEECIITIGGAANPGTWQDFVDTVLSNADKYNQQVVNWAKQCDTTNINNYKNLIAPLLDGRESEIPVNVQFSTITDLITKDGNKKPLPELRLGSLIPGKPAPYDQVNRYTVRSDIYVATKRNLPWLPAHLIGKPFILVSSNLFFHPAELLETYIAQKDPYNPAYYGVRLIPLSSQGVSFESLCSSKYKEMYSMGDDVNTNPFENDVMGVRMYIAMWNFRARIKKFNQQYKKFKNEHQGLDIEDLIKKDRETYNSLRSSRKSTYLSEDLYRQEVRNKSPELAQELSPIWEFNDSLAQLVKQFRLGYDDVNGAWVRALTNLSKTEGPYAEVLSKKPNKSILGIYITPDRAQKWEDTIDTIFKNVLDNLIQVKDATEDDIMTEISKESTLDQGWFKNKILARTDLQLEMTGEDKAKPIKIQFDNSSAFKKIPTLLSVIAHYLEIRTYWSDFDDYRMNVAQNMEGEDITEVGKNGYTVYYTDKDNQAHLIDYVAIAEALGLTTNSLEGSYTKGIGIKPYTKDADGTLVGNVDKNLQIFFNFMFHGLATTSTPNNFNNPGDLRAFDAMFKYGLKADARAAKGGGNEVAKVVSHPMLFSTNIQPGHPIVMFTPTNTDNHKTKKELSEPQDTFTINREGEGIIATPDKVTTYTYNDIQDSLPKSSLKEQVHEGDIITIDNLTITPDSTSLQIKVNDNSMTITNLDVINYFMGDAVEKLKNKYNIQKVVQNDQAQQVFETITDILPNFNGGNIGSIEDMIVSANELLDPSNSKSPLAKQFDQCQKIDENTKIPIKIKYSKDNEIVIEYFKLREGEVDSTGMPIKIDKCAAAHNQFTINYSDGKMDDLIYEPGKGVTINRKQDDAIGNKSQQTVGAIIDAFNEVITAASTKLSDNKDALLQLDDSLEDITQWQDRKKCKEQERSVLYSNLEKQDKSTYGIIASRIDEAIEQVFNDYDRSKEYDTLKESDKCVGKLKAYNANDNNNQCG